MIILPKCARMCTKFAGVCALLWQIKQALVVNKLKWWCYCYFTDLFWWWCTHFHMSQKRWSLHEGAMTLVMVVIAASLIHGQRPWRTAQSEVCWPSSLNTANISLTFSDIRINVGNSILRPGSPTAAAFITRSSVLYPSTVLQCFYYFYYHDYQKVIHTLWGTVTLY